MARSAAHHPQCTNRSHANRIQEHTAADPLHWVAIEQLAMFQLFTAMQVTSSHLKKNLGRKESRIKTIKRNNDRAVHQLHEATTGNPAASRTGQEPAAVHRAAAADQAPNRQATTEPQPNPTATGPTSGDGGITDNSTGSTSTDSGTNDYGPASTFSSTTDYAATTDPDMIQKAPLHVLLMLLFMQLLLSLLLLPRLLPLLLLLLLLLLLPLPLPLPLLTQQKAQQKQRSETITSIIASILPRIWFPFPTS